MAKKNKKCPECPKGQPAWLATYADMVTLLLTFFVLLLAMSSIEQTKFVQAMSSLRGALGVMSATGQALPITRMPMFQIGRTQQDQTIEMQLQKISEETRKDNMQEHISVKAEKDFFTLQ